VSAIRPAAAQQAVTNLVRSGTTIDIDDPILKDLKKIGAKEGKTLGRLISDLLAESLGRRRANKDAGKPQQWFSKPMGARLDIADREALYDAMAPANQAPDGSQRP
jgi:hypothetical protein